MNTFDATFKDKELERCESYVGVLEKNLQTKSRDLMVQVGYNSFMLWLGVILGIIFLRIWQRMR